MAHLGFVVFLAGLTIASWFASKVVPVDSGSAVGLESTGALAKVGAWAMDAGLFFAVGIVLMIVGGVIARRAQRVGNETSENDGPGGPQSTGLEAAIELLDSMSAKLDSLNADSLPDGSDAIAADLDAILSDQVPDFLEHRKLMIDRLGLEVFAEMIGSFAQMERGTARAWSAITDEAWSEVPPSLARAKRAAKRARELFDAKD